ncbi:hypothetical protein [Neobacillus muris]|uniref:hypothetical protein n=1 Tax=Neobacillus muris TaxID=2941334 RepID=UPI002041C7FF|nr:hypothetical protein [Neobacillus muris]
MAVRSQVIFLHQKWSKLRNVRVEWRTVYPNTLHWFQAGPEGAAVSEFSARSTDEIVVSRIQELSGFLIRIMSIL